MIKYQNIISRVLVGTFAIAFQPWTNLRKTNSLFKVAIDPCSTYANFFEKLTFLTPDTHAYVIVRKKCLFFGKFCLRSKCIMYKLQTPVGRTLQQTTSLVKLSESFIKSLDQYFVGFLIFAEISEMLNVHLSSRSLTEEIRLFQSIKSSTVML